MPTAQAQPHVFESGDKIYLVSPISPFAPAEREVEEFAFAANLKQQAPNENLLWLKGNYVEADKPNLNGHQWTAESLSIASLTPMFCPVTVMHEPTNAVGLIADAQLRTPKKDNVPRARIETALAIWAHRFPKIAEEAMHNYEAGMLMQSMECLSPYYSCAECGRTFHKLRDGAEQAQWCDHLSESPNASRILGGVTFTGTGLIFGSRGAEGAYTEAFLETAVREEIVAAHQELHQAPTGSRPKSRSRKNIMDIDQAKYDELMARPSKEDLQAANDRAEQEKERADKAERAFEVEETAKKAVETERDELKSAKETAEETARKTEMASTRLGGLGKDFKAKLGEKTTEKLTAQAKDLSDEDWEARLVELEELTAVKRDAGGGSTEAASTSTAPGDGNVTKEETASARVGAGGGAPAGAAPTQTARSSVVSGLVKRSGVPAKAE